MGFHSLPRRELQALCKKNKIAANMTNIAMADALKALLPHVKGIEEFLNPSESETPQSPEKLVIGLPDIPHTACRTSTHRKPIKEEAESSQPLTQTRRGMRRRIAGEAEEETAVMPSSRKRGPPASASRKMEIQETNQTECSLQRVYSTRQSVRLAEKKMAELSLKERGRTEPIKIHGLSKEDSDDVQENKGTDSQRKSEEHSERTNDSGVVFGGKSFGLQENSSDLKYEVQENNNREADYLNVKPEEGSAIFDVVSVADEISNKLIEKERDVEDEAHDENKGTDLQTNPEVDSERTDESDVYSDENSVLAIDLNNKTIEKKGPGGFTVNMVLSDAEKSNEVSKLEKGQDLDADQDMGSDDSDDVSSNIMDLVALPQSSLPQEIDNSASLVKFVNDSSGDSKKPELNSLNLIASADQLAVDGSGDEGWMVCSEQLGIEKEPEIPEFLDCKTSEEDFDQLVMDSKDATDAIPSKTTVDNELELQVAVGFAVQESMSFDNVKASCHADSMPEMERCNSEAWVDDVYNIEAEKLVMATTHECPPSLEKTPLSVKRTTSTRPLDSCAKVTNEIHSLLYQLIQCPRTRLTVVPKILFPKFALMSVNALLPQTRLQLLSSK